MFYFAIFVVIFTVTVSSVEGGGTDTGGERLYFLMTYRIQLLEHLFIRYIAIHSTRKYPRSRERIP